MPSLRPVSGKKIASNNARHFVGAGFIPARYPTHRKAGGDEPRPYGASCHDWNRSKSFETVSRVCAQIRADARVCPYTGRGEPYRPDRKFV